MSNFIEIIKNQKYELERLFMIHGIIDRTIRIVDAPTWLLEMEQKME